MARAIANHIGDGIARVKRRLGRMCS
jgi:hypothetical protein